MEKLWSDIREFLLGRLEVNDIVDKLQTICSQVNENISGAGLISMSYLENANRGIECITDAKENDERLRLKALLVDICNNMAHSLKEAKRKGIENVNTYPEMCTLFGIKKGLMVEIIKECQAQKSLSYGISHDMDKDLHSFVVDIPGIGQVAWHLPPNHGIKAKKYEYKVDNKDIKRTNMDFLTLNIKQKEVEQLSEHTQAVINSEDVEEMNEKLMQGDKAGLGLKKQVEKFVGKNPLTQEDSNTVNGLIDTIVRMREKHDDGILI